MSDRLSAVLHKSEFFCAPGGAEARSDLHRMMTKPYLTTVLEEAEHVAEQHNQVARTTDNQAYEYLRYAVLRVLEGKAEHSQQTGRRSTA